MRAPDGSLVYLVDAERTAPTLYEREFALEPGADTNPARLAQVDHVSIAIPEGQLDTWILFFRAAFGFTTDTVWELPDPYGLVRSRAVHSPEGTVRLPLNISQSRNTATARSVSTYSGAGVQHIALATEDIFAAAAELKRRGVAVLPIPANYYDDLIAKFAARRRARRPARGRQHPLRPGRRRRRVLPALHRAVRGPVRVRAGRAARLRRLRRRQRPGPHGRPGPCHRLASRAGGPVGTTDARRTPRLERRRELSE